MTEEPYDYEHSIEVSTHMPLARHDAVAFAPILTVVVSTHMPLARHDFITGVFTGNWKRFYSHASCEA